MKTIKHEIYFRKKASRLELLVRLIWSSVAYFVLFFYAITVAILFVIQIFHILIFGTRSRALQSVIQTYVVQRFRLSSYTILMTDERPPIIPEYQKI